MTSQLRAFLGFLSDSLACCDNRIGNWGFGGIRFMIENLFNLLSEFPLEFGDFGSVGSSRRCIRVLINLSKWGVRVLMGFILRKEELNNMFEKKARLLSYLVTVWAIKILFFSYGSFLCVY